VPLVEICEPLKRSTEHLGNIYFGRVHARLVFLLLEFVTSSVLEARGLADEGIGAKAGEDDVGQVLGTKLASHDSELSRTGILLELQQLAEVHLTKRLLHPVAIHRARRK